MCLVKEKKVLVSSRVTIHTLSKMSDLKSLHALSHVSSFSSTRK